MSQEKETRKKLIESAREEFMEKGYIKSSLRTICKKAGVTTGALYFFFTDKADLFDAVVGDTVKAVYRMMEEHFKDENKMAAGGRMPEFAKKGYAEHIETAIRTLHQMYLHRQDILLVLTKSQGTKYENIVEQFTEAAQKHYQAMAEAIGEQRGGVELDAGLVRWLAHQQMDAFVYIISHIEKEEEALPFIRQVVTYMLSGWQGLFLTKKE